MLMYVKINSIFNFEEMDKQSLAVMRDVYNKSVQDIQKYLQWPEINFRDHHPIPFVFFQKLEGTYEVVKVEVRSKELISKEDIQEEALK